MRRKTILAIALLSLSFLSPGLVAESQPQKKVMNFIAVMNLTCGKGVDKEACTALTDMAIEELVGIGKKTGKFTVIDRANRDKILSEQGFQQTGCIEESCTVDAGRLLGVGKLIVGSISKVGETYIVNLQIINVQTAAVDTATSETCKCELDGLIQTVRNVARKLMGEAPVPAPKVTPSEPKTKPIIPNAIDTAKIANSDIFPTYHAEKAMVIFYSPSYGPLARRPFFALSIDGEGIGYIVPGSYFYLEIEPGIHNFKVSYVPNPNIGGSTGDVQLTAGKTIFILAGWTSLTSKPSISIVDTDNGLAGSKKCKYKSPKVDR